MNAILLLLLALGDGPAAITAWCGGGVTGGGTGVRAEADGGLFHLQRSSPAGPMRETPLGQDADAVAAWAAALDAARFDRLRVTGAGNMTCSLARGAHRLSWPADAIPPAVPPAVQEVFRALHRWSPDAAAPRPGH